MRASFSGGIKYHSGSIAFGAFFLMLFGPLAYILMLIRELKDLLKSNKFWESFFNKCSCSCCDSIYKNLFYWVTPSGFITLSYKGKKFKESGEAAASLID